MEATPNEHFRSPTRFDGFDYKTLWFVVPDNDSSNYAEIWVQSSENKAVPQWLRFGEYIESKCDEERAQQILALFKR